MNRLTLILVTVSALLLGGAWFAARALTAEPAAPALATASTSPTAPTTPPPPTPPAVVAVQPSAPPPPAPTPVALPVTPVERGSVAPPLPAPPVNLPPVPDVPAAAASETEGSGEEGEEAFDAAWKQLKAPDLAGWRSAAKFFARCLVQTPENARCKEGLTLAEARMKAVNSTPPPMPTGRTGRHDTNYEE